MQAIISFKNLLTDLRSKLIKQVEKLTGYQWYELQNAIMLGSLALIIIKRFVILHPLLNISTIYIFAYLALETNYMYYVREAVVRLLKKHLSPIVWAGDVDSEYSPITKTETIILSPNDDFPLNDEFKKTGYWFDENTFIELDTYAKQPTLSNQLWFNFVALLVCLRLMFLAEPWLFLIGKFVLSYWLIFNKYYWLAAVISIIGIMSRIVFYLSDFTSKVFIEGANTLYKQDWNNLELENDPNMKIQPNIRNSKILTIWLTRTFKYRVLLGKTPRSICCNTVALYERAYLLDICKKSIDKETFLILYTGIKLKIFLFFVVCLIFSFYPSETSHLTTLCLYTQPIQQKRYMKRTLGKLPHTEEPKKTVIEKQGTRKIFQENPKKGGHPCEIWQYNNHYKFFTHTTLNPKSNYPFLYGQSTLNPTYTIPKIIDVSKRCKKFDDTTYVSKDKHPIVKSDNVS